MKENFYLRLTVKKLRKCKMIFWLKTTLFEYLSLCLTCILQILFDIILGHEKGTKTNIQKPFLLVNIRLLNQRMFPSFSP